MLLLKDGRLLQSSAELTGAVVAVKTAVAALRVAVAAVRVAVAAGYSATAVGIVGLAVGFAVAAVAHSASFVVVDSQSRKAVAAVAELIVGHSATPMTAAVAVVGFAVAASTVVIVVVEFVVSTVAALLVVGLSQSLLAVVKTPVAQLLAAAVLAADAVDFAMKAMKAVPKMKCHIVAAVEMLLRSLVAVLL